MRVPQEVGCGCRDRLGGDSCTCLCRRRIVGWTKRWCIRSDGSIPGWMLGDLYTAPNFVNVWEHNRTQHMDFERSFKIHFSSRIYKVKNFLCYPKWRHHPRTSSIFKRQSYHALSNPRSGLWFVTLPRGCGSSRKSQTSCVVHPDLLIVSWMNRSLDTDNPE